MFVVWLQLLGMVAVRMSERGLAPQDIEAFARDSFFKMVCPFFFLFYSFMNFLLFDQDYITTLIDGYNYNAMMLRDSFQTCFGIEVPVNSVYTMMMDMIAAIPVFHQNLITHDQTIEVRFRVFLQGFIVILH